MRSPPTLPPHQNWERATSDTAEHGLVTSGVTLIGLLKISLLFYAN